MMSDGTHLVKCKYCDITYEFRYRISHLKEFHREILSEQRHNAGTKASIHEFECKKCGKIIKFSEILPHKKICSPDEFNKHQAKAGKNGGDTTHKLHPTLAKELWKENLSQQQGETHPMYGRHHTVKAKLLIGKANKGRLLGDKNPSRRPEFREMMKNNNPSKRPDVRIKISQKLKGRQSKLKGTKFTKNHKEKISNALRGQRNYWAEGEKNWNWNGGSSFIPYCPKFNNRLKESIRNRDNRTCRLCGTKENGQKLSIHHIHYDKENCYPDLISLCHKCNSKVNNKRKYYEIFFMNNLNDRGLLFWTQRNGGK